jgi:hypothetical protein
VGGLLPVQTARFRSYTAPRPRVCTSPACQPQLATFELGIAASCSAELSSRWRASLSVLFGIVASRRWRGHVRDRCWGRAPPCMHLAGRAKRAFPGDGRIPFPASSTMGIAMSQLMSWIESGRPVWTPFSCVMTTLLREIARTKGLEGGRRGWSRRFSESP